ncbi:uncharacterized protein LOC143022512 isoform X2 [Oratosquilla oratoria]|uniref:uncharacterized protein LOC143022512 isoform X2 n=1 Tax=Oratosquilla oratoria TaxID=337810 RepID=UPI003F763F04
MHLQHGGPKQHHWTQHRRHLDRETMVKNTEVVAKEEDPQRLAILEAIWIKELQPAINRQVNDFALLPSMKPVRRSQMDNSKNSGSPPQRLPSPRQSEEHPAIRRSQRLRSRLAPNPGVTSPSTVFANL